MLLATSGRLDGFKVTKYLGIVTGEAIMGTNFIRDLLASISDIIGGRSGAYEQQLEEARNIVLNEMSERAKRLGANAVIGISLDYESVGQSMLMVVATGTAVYIEPEM
ncbi:MULTISPECIES: YbjQ family protein [Carboxydothermus]|uniref:UPF0145 protein CHY_0465 n=2 Tax=Carboxydothermus TaxID=129957 RepID=Y465_CARHZ|nr:MULTISPECIES: YbjQ family protein [Carboxydothermus]Q3AEW1.1 RecName: Full=UPF0145 protein CHY_0465 [Carboxydothermus hydrogenoformans Z-2901]ABB13898.1 conserved hypothetical protein [Carboxydothermus hydrogenoformans Z-2901]GAV25514.1 hypothetical protein ciss_14470 [Carboxydothermus islandicus]